MSYRGFQAPTPHVEEEGKRCYEFDYCCLLAGIALPSKLVSACCGKTPHPAGRRYRCDGQTRTVGRVRANSISNAVARRKSEDRDCILR
jgi:hypothetical protein